MSTIIALGYLNWAPDIHMGTGAGRHIEEIRRLMSRMNALTKASERAAVEAQMLYGVHVFARAKAIPDLAVSRGRGGVWRRDRDRRPGVVSSWRRVARPWRTSTSTSSTPPPTWLDRAAAVASANPTPLRARRMEMWRGLARCCEWRRRSDVLAPRAGGRPRRRRRETGVAMRGARPPRVAVGEVRRRAE